MFFICNFPSVCSYYSQGIKPENSQTGSKHTNPTFQLMLDLLYGGCCKIGECFGTFSGQFETLEQLSGCRVASLFNGKCGAWTLSPAEELQTHFEFALWTCKVLTHLFHFCTMFNALQSIDEFKSCVIIILILLFGKKVW